MMKINRIFQKENSADWLDELPEEVQESIMEGVKDIEKGNTYTHEQVMKDVRQKYGL